MPVIDTSSHLAAMIRAQFDARLPMQGQRQAAAVRDEPRAVRDAGDDPPKASGDAGLRRLVALRVRALAPDDPQRRRKAFRIFLESILLQTFSARRLGHGHLDTLVDVVLERMDGDPELNASLREAGELLLAGIEPAAG
jgi:hypothetical protein